MFTNSEHIGGNLGKEIKRHLNTATQVEIASGYFSVKLIEALTPKLIKVAKKGYCRLLFGMIYHERVTLRQKEFLNDLNQKLIKINQYSGVFLTVQRYHGKIFRIKSGLQDRIFIGSSNFSDNGFGIYKEFNLEIKDPAQKLEVTEFLKYLFYEKNQKKRIAYPFNQIELKLRDKDLIKKRERSLSNFEIKSSEFPDTTGLESMKILYRPSKQPKSSLNLYFDRGRKSKKNGVETYAPRKWYEVEITSTSNEQKNPIYPKGDWKAFVKDQRSTGVKYYQLNMITASGRKESPKALTTKGNRHILGEIIKGRMEDLGALRKYEQITPETLEEYGKDHITLFKIKEGLYVLEL